MGRLVMHGAAQGEDLFVIPKSEGRFYLYAPLRRRVAVINGAAVDAITDYLKAGPLATERARHQFIRALEEQGFVGGPVPAPPVFPKDYAFQPHEVTLFLTSRCNLRCRYCYADAGRKAVDMPWEVARAAIDFVAANAGILGSRKFGLGFHGGGEPTLAWDLLVQCVDYAEAKAEEMGLDVEIFAATNGLLSERQREFIRQHFKTVNVSLDGPEDVQNFNRPTVGGGGSYATICETLKYFGEMGVHHGIRATITGATVHRMREIVECLVKEFRVAYLHMEPVWQCGRCLLSGEKPPSDEAFVEHYLDAVEQGKRMGVDIRYSGARLDVLTSKFCAAPGDGFTVLPEGIVTSCFEITEPGDPRSKIFHYGRYDPTCSQFVFDHEQIAVLRSLSVENLPFCGDCFCKWHCAGDCLAKVFLRSGGSVHKGSARCTLNRSLVLAGLDALVEGQQES